MLSNVTHQPRLNVGPYWLYVPSGTSITPGT